MQIIDGKATAAQIKAEIKAEVEAIVAQGGRAPHLAAVLVGHDGGSETYVRNKVLACEACGFQSTLLTFEDTITEEELLAVVDKLNKDEAIDGFIVQLPLPRHIDEQKVTEAILPEKDVDIDDNAFKSIEAIIQSMTPYEREHPECLNTSRRHRIAKGAGVDLQQVNRLIKQFDQTRKMMKMMTDKSKMAQLAGMMKGKM